MVRATEVSLIEAFNEASLQYIINHFDEYKFRPETDTSKTLVLLNKYITSAVSHGLVRVSYVHPLHGHGRLFARDGLSLQSMPREIRNAIAFEAYDDVDMVNAHPQLLRQFCEKSNIVCPFLQRYCSHRDAVLDELESDQGRNGKKAVLAIINGGASTNHGVKVTKWLSSFSKEMKTVRQAILKLREGKPYMTMAIENAKNERDSKVKHKKLKNLDGSAVNLLLCDLEHDVLMALYDFFQKEGKSVDVLVFDGCMVRKATDKPLTIDVLQRASDHVHGKTGYRLALSVKDMSADMLAVPDEVRNSFKIAFGHQDVVIRQHMLDELSIHLAVKWPSIFPSPSAIEYEEDASLSGPSGIIRFVTLDGLSGYMDRAYRIFVVHPNSTNSHSPPICLGLVCGLSTTEPLTMINHQIRPSTHFYVDKFDDDQKGMTLTSKTPEKDNTTIAVYYSDPVEDWNATPAAIEVKFGNSKKTVATKSKVDAFQVMLKNAVEKQIKTSLTHGDKIINLSMHNCTINVNTGEKEIRLTDLQLATLIQQHAPDLLLRLRCAPEVKNDNCNGLYHCDNETNVWVQRPNLVIENLVMDVLKSDDVQAKLTDGDKRHVESRRGRADIRYFVSSMCIDEGFEAKLDTNRDLFPVHNGVFDMSRAGSSKTRFRPTTPGDYIKTTTKWAYDPEKATAHRDEVETFIGQILPVEEEREVVLAYFASLLSGRRRLKKFLVLTDKRAGDNGKSTFMALMGRFFGSLYSKNTKFVCKSTIQRGRDDHDAGLEPMKGKRLLCAEELKKDVTIDCAFMKDVTGGESVAISGRRFGSSDSFHFTWSAGVVLIFNQGDCPKFDGTDQAYMGRMVVAPFRSKFVPASVLSAICPDEYIFARNDGISCRFDDWLSSLADILVDRFDRAIDKFNNLPDSMTEWRREISEDANPFADWLDRNVECTGDKEDWFLYADLTKRYLSKESKLPDNFKDYVRTWITSKQSEFVNATSVTLGGGRKGAKNVIRKARMICDDPGGFDPLDC